MYVLLSDGERGQVTDIDRDALRFPFVEILKKKAPGKVVKTSEELSIIRPLTDEEVKAIEQ
jgi:hypothetical protein